MEKIIIKDAYENNLKHLNVEIPLEAFTCVTGCSGCGNLHWSLIRYLQRVKEDSLKE